MPAVYRLLLNLCLALTVLGACAMATRAQGLQDQVFRGLPLTRRKGAGCRI